MAWSHGLVDGLDKLLASLILAKKLFAHEEHSYAKAVTLDVFCVNPDDLDLGVFHFYWDRDAENTIEYYDTKTGERTNNTKGDWRERWYEPGEELKPVKMDNPYRPDPVKMTKWWMETHGSIQAKIMMKQREKAETEDEENRPWHHIPKPQWEN